MRTSLTSSYAGRSKFASDSEANFGWGANIRTCTPSPYLPQRGEVAPSGRSEDGAGGGQLRGNNSVFDSTYFINFADSRMVILKRYQFGLG